VDGDAVREWRQAHGLSQEGLARLLGTTKGAVYFWESGRRKPPPMLELALWALDRQMTEEQQA
jgi:DNA-binding transcriptional regulator YiaG